MRNTKPKRMNKYPNGYLPKIEYWQSQFSKAVEVKDWEFAEKSLKKLMYFASAQYVKENQVPYQPSSVIAGVDFSQALEGLKSL